MPPFNDPKPGDPGGLNRRNLLAAGATASAVLPAASGFAQAASVSAPAAPADPRSSLPVELSVNGSGHKLAVDPRRHVARHPARAAGAHRVEEGLRPRTVRRLHRAGGRTPRAVLPDAGGGRARAGDHHRGPGRPRGRAPPDAAGLHRPRRLPVRLLHAGPDHERRRLRRGGARRLGRGDPRVHERQPVPLRRLPAYPSPPSTRPRRRRRPQGRPDRCAPSPTPAPPTHPPRCAPPRSPACARPRPPRPSSSSRGGTNIIDFMKLGSWEAASLVDINDLEREHGAISAGSGRPAPRRPGADEPGGGRPDGQPRLPGDRAKPEARGLRPAAEHGEPGRQRASAHPLHLLPQSRLRPLQQARARVRLRRDRRDQSDPRGAGRERPLHLQLSRRLRPGARGAGRPGGDARPRRTTHPAVRGPPHRPRAAGSGDGAGARRVDHGLPGAFRPAHPPLDLREGARPRELRVRPRHRRSGSRPRARPHGAGRADRHGRDGLQTLARPRRGSIPARATS